MCWNVHFSISFKVDFSTTPVVMFVSFYPISFGIVFSRTFFGTKVTKQTLTHSRGNNCIFFTTIFKLPLYEPSVPSGYSINEPPLSKGIFFFYILCHLVILKKKIPLEIGRAHV